MAEIGYRAQLPQSIVARRVQFAPANGAAIGQGLERLGKTLLQVHFNDKAADREVAESQARIAGIEQQRARGQAVADGLGRMTQAQLDTETELDALKDSTEPGAPEYAAKAEELIRRKWQEFRDTLPNDPEVQQHFDEAGARWTAAAIGQARDYERVERTKNMGANLDLSVNTSASALLAKPDGTALDALVGEYDRAIDAQLLPGTDKAKMKVLVRQKLTGAMFDGMLQQGGFDAAEAALATGKFDWMGPEAKGRLVDQIGAGRDAAARAAETAANDAKRVAIDALAALKVRIEDGRDMPSPTAIEAALQAARAAGAKDADLLEFAYLAEDGMARRAAQGLQTPAIEDRLTLLRGRRGAGKASDADVREQDALEAELKARDVKAGGGIKELAKADPGAATAQLAAMPVNRRWAAATEAGDTRLAVYANLTPNGRSFAIEGRKLRGDRPDDFLPPKGARGASGGKDGAKAIFNAVLGRDLIDQLGGGYDEHFDAALDAMAGMARKWDEASFRRAIQLTFGATHRGNGVWQGGLGKLKFGQVVELPNKWTAAEFDSLFQRQALPGAAYADGRVAPAADIKRHYRLRYEREDAQGNTFYKLVGPDGRLLYKQGLKEPYTIHAPPRPR